MRITPLILAALLLSGTAAAAQTQPPFATIFCVTHAIYCDPDGLDHLVLLVNTSIGIYVLDNLSPLMWRIDQETRYHWISRQVFGSPREWVSMEQK